MYEKADKINYALLIIGVILMILFMIFMYNILKYHKRNLRLYLSYLKAEVEGREKERIRISKDLHDDLGANLSSIKMILQGVTNLPEKQRDMLVIANNQLQLTIDSLRNLMIDLYPTLLERFGLIFSIEDLVNTFNHTTAIKINFNNQVVDLDNIIRPEHKIHIFRIIKEIIQNTIKHSNSIVLYITILEQKSSILIETIDNGSGFDTSNENYFNKGEGLKNISSRIELMQGSILLDKHSDSGVKYCIEIPKYNA